MYNRTVSTYSMNLFHRQYRVIAVFDHIISKHFRELIASKGPRTPIKVTYDIWPDAFRNVDINRALDSFEAAAEIESRHLSPPTPAGAP